MTLTQRTPRWGRNLALTTLSLVAIGGGATMSGRGSLAAQPAAAPTAYVVTINPGTCDAPGATASYEIGSTLPWGIGLNEQGQIEGTGALHVMNTVDVALTDLTGGSAPMAVIVGSPDDPTTVVACGEIANLVVDGQVAIALEPVAGSGVAGVALLDADQQGFLGLGESETQVTAYLLAGLGAGGTMAMPTGTAAPAATATATADIPDLAVTIDTHDLYFEPNVLVLPADTPITVTLTNEGEAVHNFSVTDHGNAGLENLNIDVTVNPGETKTFTINAPAADYYFFCNQPGHEAAGMRGYLQVQDGAKIVTSAATVTPRPE